MDTREQVLPISMIYFGAIRGHAPLMMAMSELCVADPNMELLPQHVNDNNVMIWTTLAAIITCTPMDRWQKLPQRVDSDNDDNDADSYQKPTSYYRTCADQAIADHQWSTRIQSMFFPTLADDDAAAEERRNTVGIASGNPQPPNSTSVGAVALSKAQKWIHQHFPHETCAAIHHWLQLRLVADSRPRTRSYRY
jgi:hypothetical protein